jgi:hypothetical protein
MPIEVDQGRFAGEHVTEIVEVIIQSGHTADARVHQLNQRSNPRLCSHGLLLRREELAAYQSVGLPEYLVREAIA